VAVWPPTAGLFVLSQLRILKEAGCDSEHVARCGVRPDDTAVCPRQAAWWQRRERAGAVFGRKFAVYNKVIRKCSEVQP